MRCFSSSSESTRSIRKRSHSSASPAAVGKSRTGVPKSPQRTTSTSWPRRSEYHVALSLLMGGRERASTGERGRELLAGLLAAALGRRGGLLASGGDQSVLLDRGALAARAGALGSVELAPLLDLG